MRTNIIVTLQVEGLHCWPECPIEEVEFLKSPHRHIFHIECKKEVTHSDRDIEIIKLKRKILDHIMHKYGTSWGRLSYVVVNFGKMSCEQIAEELLIEFELNYCKVLEDNENGAEVLL